MASPSSPYADLGLDALPAEGASPYADLNLSGPPKPEEVGIVETIGSYVPEWMKAVLELPGAAAGAILGPLAAGTEAYKKAGAQRFEALTEGGAKPAGLMTNIRAAPSYFEALKGAKVKPPTLEALRTEVAFDLAHPTIAKVKDFTLDAAIELVGLAANIGTDISVAATGTVKGAAAAVKGAAKAGSALERLKGLAKAGAALYGSPAAGAIYLPEVAQTIETGIEEGRPGQAAGAGVMGALVLLGLKHELTVKAGKPPSDAVVAAELAGVRAKLEGEGGPPAAAPAAPAPSAASGKLETPLPDEGFVPEEGPPLDLAGAPSIYGGGLKLGPEAIPTGRPTYTPPTIARRLEGGGGVGLQEALLTLPKGRRPPLGAQERFPQPPPGPPSLPPYERPLIEQRLPGGARGAPWAVQAMYPPTAPSARAAMEAEGLAAALPQPEIGDTAVHWGERGTIVEITGDLVDIRMPNGKTRTVGIDKLTDIRPSEPPPAGPPGLEEVTGPPTEEAAAAVPPAPAPIPRSNPISATTPLKDRLAAGNRVYHPRYGELTIEMVEPDGSITGRTLAGKQVNVINAGPCP